MTTTADGQAKVEEIVQKIDETIETQVSAIDDSIWADAPELTEDQEKQLAAAAKSASTNTEYDDTNHADDQEGGKAATGASATIQPVDDEVPAGEEPVAQPEAKGEVQEPEFDPALIAAAGLASVEEAKIQFGTPKALENAVRLIDMRSVNVAEAALNEFIAKQAVQSTQQQQMPTPAQAPAFKMPPPPEGEEWDDATIALFKGLHDQFAQKLDAQRAEIEAAKAFQNQLTIEREKEGLKKYVEEFDGFVTKLGDDWKPLLGDQSGFELKHDSLQLKNRIHLDTVAKQLAYGRQTQGLQELPREELLGRALRVAFPQKQEQVVRRQIEEEVSKRSRMVTNRPTSKSTNAKTGDSAAASYAEQWYAKRGMTPMLNDDIEYDEI